MCTFSCHGCISFHTSSKLVQVDRILFQWGSDFKTFLIWGLWTSQNKPETQIPLFLEKKKNVDVICEYFNTSQDHVCYCEIFLLTRQKVWSEDISRKHICIKIYFPHGTGFWLRLSREVLYKKVIIEFGGNWMKGLEVHCFGFGMQSRCFSSGSSILPTVK